MIAKCVHSYGIPIPADYDGKDTFFYSLSMPYPAQILLVEPIFSPGTFAQLVEVRLFVVHDQDKYKNRHRIFRLVVTGTPFEIHENEWCFSHGNFMLNTLHMFLFEIMAH